MGAAVHDVGDAIGRNPATEITVGKFLLVLRSPAGADVARRQENQYVTAAIQRMSTTRWLS
jgi:hypothetical protein